MNPVINKVGRRGGGRFSSSCFRSIYPIPLLFRLHLSDIRWLPEIASLHNDHYRNLIALQVLDISLPFFRLIIGVEWNGCPLVQLGTNGDNDVMAISLGIMRRYTSVFLNVDYYGIGLRSLPGGPHAGGIPTRPAAWRPRPRVFDRKAARDPPFNVTLRLDFGKSLPFPPVLTAGA